MSRVLHLEGKEVSLVLDLDVAGGPLLLHWGAKLEGAGLERLADVAARAVGPASLDLDPPEASLFPVPGGGVMGHPALLGGRGGRDWTADFGPWTTDDENGVTVLHARDAAAVLALTLRLRLDPADDVLVLSAELANEGDEPYEVHWLAAASLALPYGVDELLSPHGRWGLEFQLERERLGGGTWLVENRRGRTSHFTTPSVVLGRPGFTVDQGEVYGVHLGWSGNARLLVQRLDDGRRQVMAGELFVPGEIALGPGKSLRTPEVYAAHAKGGLNALMQRHHAHVRRTVLPWRGGATPPRPVTLNTWEANYFAHDETRLMAQAAAAAALGVERFVLDDGWFSGRDDDTGGLGDWYPDSKKYPEGLAPLVRRVTKLGMGFGLWVEPEMVSVNSDLYRAHPDWVLRAEGRPHITGRNQLVLDLTRDEVRDHLFAALDTLLRDHAITYLKWDMNRDLAAAGDAAGRAAYHRQSLSLYDLLDRLRGAHPDVEIETCASGGGRADYGVLRRTHRVWTSDCTDALDRVAIQRGFALFFPPEVMGAHVSAVPNHQTGRRHGLAFRAIVALFGHFGLELDPLTLGAAERDELKVWIALHKRLRPLLHAGTFWHLAAEAGRTGHGVVSADRRHAVFAVVGIAHQPTKLPPPLRLIGLDPNLAYEITLPPPGRLSVERPTSAHQALVEGRLIVPGDVLMKVGLSPPELWPEKALLFELQALGEA